MQSRTRGEESQRRDSLTYYKPEATNEFTTCVISIPSTLANDLTIQELREVVKTQVGNRFNVREPDEGNVTFMMRRAPLRTPIANETYAKDYKLIHPITKRECKQENEHRTRVRDLLCGGDGTEVSPFTFMVRTYKYKYFRLFSDRGADCRFAVEEMLAEAMSLRHMRQHLVSTCQVRVDHLHFQRVGGGLAWAKHEEKKAHALSSMPVITGSGKREFPFVFCMMYYYRLMFEFQDDSHTTRAVCVKIADTKTMTLVEFRQFLFRTSGPRPFQPSTRRLKDCFFLDPLRGGIIFRKDESSKKLIDVVDKEGRTGDRGSDFIVHLKEILYV